ncbi:hypothetical protein I7I48_02612 [Histoplasma ohiense]|nr:hypothetical protein I7I48_02612 [Histoplasma ohiense (nom. inval.)]
MPPVAQSILGRYSPWRYGESKDGRWQPRHGRLYLPASDWQVDDRDFELRNVPPHSYSRSGFELPESSE